MVVAIQISPNRSLYIRDPQSTETGRNILRHSIPLMADLGFEKFTFKKLSERMGSSEITVYRYFENKHRLLLYLLSYYWEWIKYSILFNLQNLDDSGEKLKIAIRTVVDSNRRNSLVDYIDEAKLFDLVIEESEKTFHTKDVDQENKEGFFLTLKSLKSEIAEIIQEVRPDYAFPNSLASTILEMSASLRFYAKHLPSLSEVSDLSRIDDHLCDYLEDLAFSAIS
jgi:AcrR family transcriptional regulator